MRKRTTASVILLFGLTLQSPALTISGTVRRADGNPLPNTCTVRASNGGGVANTGSGAYSLVGVPSGWSGVVVVEHTVNAESVVFGPAYRAYTNLTTDQIGQDFRILPGQPKTIAGTITNLAGQGVSNVLLAATTGGGAALTSPSGAYNLGYHHWAEGTWNGTVTPTKSGCVFAPTSRAYASINTSQSHEHYLATHLPPTLSKSLAPAFAATGAVVRVILTVTNQSETSSEETSVYDPLPPELLCTTNSLGPGGVYTAAHHTVTWNLGILAPGEVCVLSFDTRVAGTAQAGQVISNTARIVAGTATNLSNLTTVRVPLDSPVLGRIALARRTSPTAAHLRLIDRDGGNDVFLTDSPHRDARPHFRPDGTQLVFARTVASQPPRTDVLRIDADGTAETNLTHSIAGDCNGPRWSWDGQRIVFDVTASGDQGDLYLMQADGSGITPLLTSSMDDRAPSFSPDGAWIVFQRVTQTIPRRIKICKLRLSDGEVIDLTDASTVDESPMWSPDGTTIIFRRGIVTWDLFAMSANHDPNSLIGLLNLTQTATRPIGTAQYTWENDGIVYQTTTGSVASADAEIFRMNRIGGNVQQLTTNAVEDLDPAPAPVKPFVPTPVLAIAKSADALSVTGGQSVVFSIAITNTSMLVASNVVVRDTLDSQLDCEPGSISSGGAYALFTRTITWTQGTLEAGAGTSFTFRATVAADASYFTPIVNLAAVTTDQTETNWSNAVWLRVPLPVRDEHRFGGGSLMGVTNFVNRMALGITYGRLSISLTPAQCANPYLIDFGPADLALARAQSNGLRAIGLIDLQASLLTWPTVADFGRAVAAIIERYDGDGVEDMPGLIEPIRHWEIFDGYAPATDPQRWAGCDVERYGRYLTNAWQIAHASSPHATVLCSALTGSPEATNGWYLTPLLTHEWVRPCIDAIPYRSYLEKTVWTNGTEHVPQYLFARQFMAYLADQGLDDRTVWAAETDFRSTYTQNLAAGVTNSQADNAHFLARAYPFALAAGIDRILYTELEYDPAFPAALNWAVLTNTNLNRRANFYVYQKLIEKLEGYQRAHLRKYGNDTIGAYFVSADGQPVQVVWNTSERTEPVRVPVGPVLLARVTRAVPDTFDNTQATWTVTFLTVTNGYCDLDASGTPVYVEAQTAFPEDLDGDGIPNDLDDDTDGDGMSDEWEYTYGLDIFTAGATRDTDGDGQSDFNESVAGTDPTNRLSYFQVDSVRPVGAGQVAVGWQGVGTRYYGLDYRDWSPGETWDVAPGADKLPGRDGAMCFTNPIAPGTNRFYRLRVWTLP